MQQHIRVWVSEIVKNHPEAVSSPILEFGSLQVSGQEGFADLRPYFPNMNYIGIDIRSGVGVDVIGNVENIEYPNSSIGVVVSTDTFEHVLNPWKAIDEIYRVLKPGGLFLLTSVFVYPIHDHPADYWRFTPEIFREFFKSYTTSEVTFVGDTLNPISVLGWGIK